MFYWISVQRIEDEAALWRAADSLLTFLESTGRTNILIEIANKIDVVVDHTPYDLFTPDRPAEMIIGLRPPEVEAAIQAIRAIPAWQANPKPIVVWRGLARFGSNSGRWTAREMPSMQEREAL